MSVTSHNHVGTELVDVSPAGVRDTPSPQRNVIAGASNGEAWAGGVTVEHNVVAGLQDGPHDHGNAEVPSGGGNTEGGMQLLDGELIRRYMDTESRPNVVGRGALEEYMFAHQPERRRSKERTRGPKPRRGVSWEIEGVPDKVEGRSKWDTRGWQPWPQYP
jgi:hypothetical protein